MLMPACRPSKPRSSPLAASFGDAQSLPSSPSCVNGIGSATPALTAEQPTILLFLFCSPSLDDLFALSAPQPFVLLYANALGTPGQLILTIVAIIGLVTNTCVAIVAASRLVFAVARDGVLPGSSWIGRVGADGQPRNAVTFIGVLAALLLCTILPSSVAFTSLISAGSVPSVAAYGLIALLRLTITRGRFDHARWSLGRWSTPFAVVSVVWCGAWPRPLCQNQR
jgi:amino acid transporter